MKNNLLIADVGGTFTRVRLIKDDECVSQRRASVSSVGGLLDLLDECIGSTRPVRYGVLAVAGAVVHCDRVNMTNWPGTPEITVGWLIDSGLVAGASLINDMQAAGIGLGQELAASGSAEPPKVCECLNDARPAFGNFILIAPGTGLGAVAGVAVQDGTAGLPFKVLPIEAQHTEASCPREDWSGLWRNLGDELGRHPSWEDLVSGRGLERIFGLLGGDRSLAAAQIAAQADPKANSPASQALTVYYHCAIRFSQLLALTIRPHRGMFLGGESTIRNRSFLGALKLSDWFIENPVRESELKLLPIYLDPSTRVLDGALAKARFQLSQPSRNG